jgi:hypothetical protein
VGLLLLLRAASRRHGPAAVHHHAAHPLQYQIDSQKTSSQRRWNHLA